MDLTVEGKAYIDGSFQDCCLGITDGKISAIKKILKGDKHITFNHRLILPAGIDIHVHFRDPGMTHKEDFSTGSMAAAFGGVSCYYDMPNTIPQTTDMSSLLDKIKSSEKKSFVDFGIYAGISDRNIQNIAKIGEKCSGFKIYLGSTTNSLLLNSKNLRDVFKAASSTNKPILIHAEDNQCLINHKSDEHNLTDHLKCRPSECEEMAIKKILTSSKSSKNKIHICHLSSLEGLELLKDKQKNISCGVTPHHLLLNIEKNLSPKTWHKVNPPIRTDIDRDALFGGIQNGSIDVLESDHAPHTLDEKNTEFNDVPSGIPGVETLFPMFLYLAKKEKISFGRLISLFCENPAEIVNVPKGKLEIGKDADFIVIDYRDESKVKSEHLHSKCGWSPFEGWPAIFPTHVFVRGEKLIEEHEMLGNQGFGRFVDKW